MRHCLAVVLVLASAPVSAAETYRWVDEKGVVNSFDRVKQFR
jgi:hypothetical protein